MNTITKKKLKYTFFIALFTAIAAIIAALSCLDGRAGATYAGLFFLSLTPVVLIVSWLLAYMLPLIQAGKPIWIRVLIFIAISILAIYWLARYVTE
ncbi:MULTISPECIES: hypothetical protein [Chitinophagaceae]